MIRYYDLLIQRNGFVWIGDRRMGTVGRDGREWIARCSGCLPWSSGHARTRKDAIHDLIGHWNDEHAKGGDRWLAAHDAQKRAEWEAEQEADEPMNIAQQVTDDMVAEALDAKASMSKLHCYLYSTEKCRCGEEWTDAHWMRFILERALSRAEREADRRAGCHDRGRMEQGRSRFGALDSPPQGWLVGTRR